MQSGMASQLTTCSGYVVPRNRAEPNAGELGYGPRGPRRRFPARSGRGKAKGVCATSLRRTVPTDTFTRLIVRASLSSIIGGATG